MRKPSKFEINFSQINDILLLVAIAFIAAMALFQHVMHNVKADGSSAEWLNSVGVVLGYV